MLRASASTPHPSHKPIALRVHCVSASLFRTSSHHVHHALCLNDLGGSYTLALGSCIIASSDSAITKATTSGNVRASASTPHPSHKPSALRVHCVSASLFRTSSHHTSTWVAPTLALVCWPCDNESKTMSNVKR